MSSVNGRGGGYHIVLAKMLPLIHNFFRFKIAVFCDGDGRGYQEGCPHKMLLLFPNFKLGILMNIKAQECYVFYCIINFAFVLRS